MSMMKMTTGGKDIRMTIRNQPQPEFSILATSVFNLSFVERKFLHIGCTWVIDQYVPIIIIITPSMYFWMSADNFINFLNIIGELISFMDDSCKSKIYLSTEFNIVKSKCFSKNYLSISGRGVEQQKTGCESLTVENLMEIKEIKQCLVEVVKEKYETCNLLSMQSKEIYEKAKDMMINKFLLLPENLVFTIVKNINTSLLPKTSMVLYNEIITFDYKCIVKRIWDQFVSDFKKQTNQDILNVMNNSTSSENNINFNQNNNWGEDETDGENTSINALNTFAHIQKWETCNDLIDLIDENNNSSDEELKNNEKL
ncbi:uncharacterized protein LOC126897274 [Daktulosphaira vitifoliae]|uniref:uncharacterized protein LOC126897274 n=1 Tax=Daktulosphaira vitifoliae TaxID=58002 RepID=UPI0021A9B255|nr:uncharacterized protein LOC126897274 [Daktulosphaira vitifoliae]